MRVKVEGQKQQIMAATCNSPASSTEEGSFLCRFVFGIYGTCGQLSGNLADPQCADKECQFCRLLPDCCLLFFTGQSFVLLAYAVGWP